MRAGVRGVYHRGESARGSCIAARPTPRLMFLLEKTMHRRTFIASVPAAVSAPLLAGSSEVAGAAEAGGKTTGGGPRGQAAAGPSAWAPGEERFVRNDVHAGDRIVGASFASRSAVYGTSGAAGSAHPLATQTGIEILKRGGSAIDAAVA